MTQLIGYARRVEATLAPLLNKNDVNRSNLRAAQQRSQGYKYKRARAAAYAHFPLMYCSSSRYFVGRVRFAAARRNQPSPRAHAVSLSRARLACLGATGSPRVFTAPQRAAPASHPRARPSGDKFPGVIGGMKSAEFCCLARGCDVGLLWIRGLRVCGSIGGKN